MMLRLTPHTVSPHEADVPQVLLHYYIRGVTVHVFVPNIFGSLDSVRTARVKHHWKCTVLYIVTFDKKHNVNLFMNSKNKCRVFLCVY